MFNKPSDDGPLARAETPGTSGVRVANNF